MSRVFVLGTEVDPITLEEAVSRIARLARSRDRHFVVTPNVDHVIRLRSDRDFRDAYAAATLVLADGMPLVWASRLTRSPLPERVAGADLVLPVLAAAERDGLGVFFLGPMAETLNIALGWIGVRFPRLRIAGAHAPPRDFERDQASLSRSVAALRAANPDIVFLALGTPKQELWIARHRDELNFGVALCIGAGIDFIAGVQKRCPRILSRLSLEWAWRVYREPKRLWRRYAHCLLLAPILMWEQLRHAWRFRARG